MSTSFENGVQVRFNPLGHFQITVDDTPQNLPDPGVDPNRVRRIVIRPLGGDICYRDDGSDPTGDGNDPGMPIMEEEVLVYDGLFPTEFRMIRHVSGIADVRIAYYGT